LNNFLVKNDWHNWSEWKSKQRTQFGISQFWFWEIDARAVQPKLLLHNN